ncbi:MAG TPA: imidazolonepropionase [Candidatus Thermoplasmatota archaeon]|nr:imidazolonepropionase [Candidatus Thermoplasmatota archaeon]
MAKPTYDLVVHGASELLTLAGPPGPRTGTALQELGVVEDGAVAIVDGTIARVGTTAELKKLPARRKIDAEGRVVLPGFVDAHSHACFAGSREDELGMKLDGLSYEEIARQGGGILSTMRQTRDASLADLCEETAQRLESMLVHGTTTAETKSGYALTTKGELRMLEAIAQLSREQPVELVPTFLGAHAIPPEFAGKADDYVTLVVDDMLPAVAASGLARFCDVFVDAGAFNLQQGRRILKAGKALGLAPKVHADELTRSGGADLAIEVGAVSADHLLQTPEKGLRGLAREGIVGVMLPATPFASFMKTYPDGAGMVDKGMAVALGSDLCPNAWSESMQFALQLAVYRCGLFVSEAITAATINAAHAIGRANAVGSLAPGKQADLLILDAPGYEWLGYRLGVNLVDTVVKRGKVVVEGGAPV